MKELKCGDAGFDCDAVVRAESEEEVLGQAGAHAESVHGATVTPEMKRELASHVHDV